MDKLRLIKGTIKEEDVDKRPIPAEVFFVSKNERNDANGNDNETDNTNA